MKEKSPLLNFDSLFSAVTICYGLLHKVIGECMYINEEWCDGVFCSNM